MNTVSVIGNLVRDPEMKFTSGGEAVASLRVAVRGAGDKQDDGSYGAGFFNVTLFGRQAEIAEQYLTKGAQAGFSGSLRFHEWEAKDGSGKRSAVEINAQRLTLIGGRSSEDNDGQQAMTGSASTASAPEPDDDIPF